LTWTSGLNSKLVPPATELYQKLFSAWQRSHYWRQDEGGLALQEAAEVSALICRSLEVVVCTRRKEVGVEQKKRIIEQHGTGVACGSVEGPQELVPHVRIERFEGRAYAKKWRAFRLYPAYRMRASDGEGRFLWR
jgi:hypothetical protein